MGRPGLSCTPRFSAGRVSNRLHFWSGFAHMPDLTHLGARFRSESLSKCSKRAQHEGKMEEALLLVEHISIPRSPQAFSQGYGLSVARIVGHADREPPHLSRKSPRQQEGGKAQEAPLSKKAREDIRLEPRYGAFPAVLTSPKRVVQGAVSCYAPSFFALLLSQYRLKLLSNTFTTPFHNSHTNTFKFNRYQKIVYSGSVNVYLGTFMSLFRYKVTRSDKHFASLRKLIETKFFTNTNLSMFQFCMCVPSYRGGEIRHLGLYIFKENGEWFLTYKDANITFNLHRFSKYMSNSSGVYPIVIDMGYTQYRSLQELDEVRDMVGEYLDSGVEIH